MLVTSIKVSPSELVIHGSRITDKPQNLTAYYLDRLFFEEKKKFDDGSFSPLSPFDRYCNDGNPNQIKQEIYQRSVKKRKKEETHRS